MAEFIEIIVMALAFAVFIWNLFKVLAGIDGLIFSMSLSPYVFGFCVNIIFFLGLGLVWDLDAFLEGEYYYFTCGLLFALLLAPSAGRAAVQRFWWVWQKIIYGTGAFIGFLFWLFLAALMDIYGVDSGPITFLYPLTFIFSVFGGAWLYSTLYVRVYPIVYWVKSTSLLYGSLCAFFKPQWFVALFKAVTGDSSILYQNIILLLYQNIILLFFCGIFVCYVMWIQRFAAEFREHFVTSDRFGAAGILGLFQEALDRILTTASLMIHFQRAETLDTIQSVPTIPTMSFRTWREKFGSMEQKNEYVQEDTTSAVNQLTQYHSRSYQNVGGEGGFVPGGDANEMATIAVADASYSAVTPVQTVQRADAVSVAPLIAALDEHLPESATAAEPIPVVQPTSTSQSGITQVTALEYMPPQQPQTSVQPTTPTVPDLPSMEDLMEDLVG